MARQGDSGVGSWWGCVRKGDDEQAQARLRCRRGSLCWLLVCIGIGLEGQARFGADCFEMRVGKAGCCGAVEVSSGCLQQHALAACCSFCA